MSNPYLDRLARQGKKSHGFAAEAKTSKRLGGSLRPGSGNIEGLKGDFTVDGFLFENKSTIKKSMSIKYEWLDKVSKEALSEGKTAAVSIQFVEADGTPLPGGAWVLVPESYVRGV